MLTFFMLLLKFSHMIFELFLQLSFTIEKASLAWSKNRLCWFWIQVFAFFETVLGAQARFCLKKFPIKYFTLTNSIITESETNSDENCHWALHIQYSLQYFLKHLTLPLQIALSMLCWTFSSSDFRHFFNFEMSPPSLQLSLYCFSIIFHIESNIGFSLFFSSFS